MLTPSAGIFAAKLCPVSPSIACSAEPFVDVLMQWRFLVGQTAQQIVW